jgi:hypothetical protein
MDRALRRGARPLLEGPIVGVSVAARARRVGFVTSAQHRGLTDDDRSASPAMVRHGLEVLPVVWTEPVPEGLEALVLRSTWDYHLRLPEFLGWLDTVETRGPRLWNHPSTVRRNVDKKYLLEVEARGVPIVPTRHLARGSTLALPELLRDAGWSEAVVKPSISGGAFETWRAGPGEEDAARFARQLEAMDCLVQPFVPELISGGEWSLLFFRGRYSHAVLKRPEPGDFRVQEEFGGVFLAADPPSQVVVIRNGRFELMELELVEPSLFLEASPGAAERFAAAIAETLGG